MRSRTAQFAATILVVLACGCGLDPNNQARLDGLIAGGGGSAPITAHLLLADGSAGKLYSYSTCQSLATVNTSGPLPGTGGVNEPEISPGAYSAVEVQDSVFYTGSECPMAGSQNIILAELGWDVSSFDLSKYTSFAITWVGRLGAYGGSCSGSAPTSINSTAKVQIYNGSMWSDLSGTPGTTSSVITQTFGLPDTYATSGKIWIRIYTDSATSMCATVQTDFASLEISP